MEAFESAGLQLFSEGRFLNEGEVWSSVLASGLWFGLMLQGHMHIERGDGSSEVWVSGMHRMFVLDEAEEIAHSTSRSGTCTAVFLHVEFRDLSILTGQDDPAAWDLGTVQARSFSKRDAVRFGSIATSIAGCQLDGAARRFFLTGKAMEMMSVAFSATQTPQDIARHLSGQDISKLRAARDLAASRIEDPLTIPELATQVGMSVRKLTDGFRREFGTSIYAFVKSERLAQARCLLEDGEMTVSEIAYSLGYAPAHFSALCRREFGASPRELLRSSRH